MSLRGAPVSDFEDGGLFDDIAPPAGTASANIKTSPPKESVCAHRAWSLWCDLTKRPDKGSIDRKFLRIYVEQLRANRRDEYLLDVVRGAARMPVKGLGGNDTMRVTNALSSVGIGRTAVSLLSTDQPVILFPSPDDAVLLCGINDIVEACRVPVTEWTARDQDAAGVIMEKMTPEQLDEAATEASRAIGMDGVLPVDIICAFRSTKRGLGAGKKSAKRRTYSAGVVERERVKDVAFAIDDMAQKMLMKGAKSADIIRLHGMAPDGYWDAVFDLAVEGDSNESAYTRLQEKFDGWHPRDRVL